jgi:hypothetical protein
MWIDEEAPSPDADGNPPIYVDFEMRSDRPLADLRSMLMQFAAQAAGEERDFASRDKAPGQLP